MYLMKKYFAVGLTFLILILGSITSCQNDEIPIDPIVGIWEFSESTEDFSRTVQLTFNADNTGLEEIEFLIYDQPDSSNSNFVYLLKDSILTLIFGVEPTDYPYTISGNKLTITYPDEVLVFTRKQTS